MHTTLNSLNERLDKNVLEIYYEGLWPLILMSLYALLLTPATVGSIHPCTLTQPYSLFSKMNLSDLKDITNLTHQVYGTPPTHAWILF